MSASRTLDGHKSIFNSHSDVGSLLLFIHVVVKISDIARNKTRNNVHGDVLCSADEGPTRLLLLSLITELLFIVQLQFSKFESFSELLTMRNPVLRAHRSDYRS